MISRPLDNQGPQSGQLGHSFSTWNIGHSLSKVDLVIHMLLWVSQLLSCYQIIYGYMENIRQGNQGLQVRRASSLLVHSHGTGADVQLPGKLSLAHPTVFSELRDV